MSKSLSFNISKSTPTTSTTNTTTASGNLAEERTPKPPLLHALSKKLEPAVVVALDVESTGRKSDESTDLIGLFDKFDVREEPAEDPRNEDPASGDVKSENPLEEKFKQFSPEETETTKEAESKEIEEDKSIDNQNIEATLVGEPSDASQQTQSPRQPSEKVSYEDNADEGQSALTAQQDAEDRHVSSPTPESMSVQAYEIPADWDAPKQPKVLYEPSARKWEPIGEVGVSEGETSKAEPLVRPSRTRNNSLRGAQLHLNASEQHQLSHKPFDFQVFLNHLKKKSADPIVRYIRSFLVSFSKQSPSLSLEQKTKIIRDFKEFINQKFEVFEPFASMDALDLENSREGVEKLVMNRLYEFCFPPELLKKSPLCAAAAKDVNDDVVFSQQLDKFSWVNGHHLDVDLEYLTKDNRNFMDLGVQELNKLGKYRAPRDKIICVLNACKIIFGFLKVSKQETNADAFIPLLILIIIKAKTPDLISNMHYIENFRGDEWLNHGETSYYLSSLQGAIGFIQDLDFELLSISREEYDAHIEAWNAAASTRPPIDIVPSKPVASPQQSLSPSNVLLLSAEMFTKTISSFLSPSYTPEPEAEVPETTEPRDTSTTYKQLREIFPNLDKAILKDIVVLNKGELDPSLEACLQLVNDV